MPSTPKLAVLNALNGDKAADPFGVGEVSRQRGFGIHGLAAGAVAFAGCAVALSAILVVNLLAVGQGWQPFGIGHDIVGGDQFVFGAFRHLGDGFGVGFFRDVVGQGFYRTFNARLVALVDFFQLGKQL